MCEFLLVGKPELLHFAPYTRDQIVKIIQDRLTVVSYSHFVWPEAEVCWINLGQVSWKLPTYPSPKPTFCPK